MKKHHTSSRLRILKWSPLAPLAGFLLGCDTDEGLSAEAYTLPRPTFEVSSERNPVNRKTETQGESVPSNSTIRTKREHAGPVGFAGTDANSLALAHLQMEYDESVIVTKSNDYTWGAVNTGYGTAEPSINGSRLSPDDAVLMSSPAQIGSWYSSPRLVTVDRDSNASDDNVFMLNAVEAYSGYDEPSCISAAYFPFSQGWRGGHAIADNWWEYSLTNESIGSLTSTDYGRVELRIPNANSEDGMLFVVGAGDYFNDNTVSTGSLPNGDWDIAVRDNGGDFFDFSHDDFSYIYIPFDSPHLGAGADISPSGEVLRSTGSFKLQQESEGLYRLTLSHYHPDDGILLVSIFEDGYYYGEKHPEDYVVSHTAEGSDFLIQTLDMPYYDLQDAGFVFSFFPFKRNLVAEAGALTADVGTTWPKDIEGNFNIEVCFSNPDLEDSFDEGEPVTRKEIPEHQKKLIESDVRKSWGRVTGINFWGWKDCEDENDDDNNNDSSGRIAIRGWGSTLIGGSGKHSTHDLGYQGEDDALIGFDLGLGPTYVGVVHEFGHALGFKHVDDEHFCDEPDDDPEHYNSIMCSGTQNTAEDFSEGDIISAQAYYGRPSRGSLISHGGGCLGGESLEGGHVGILPCAPTDIQSWGFWGRSLLLGPGRGPSLEKSNSDNKMVAEEKGTSERQKWYFSEVNIVGLGGTCIGVSESTDIVMRKCNYLSPGDPQSYYGDGDGDIGITWSFSPKGSIHSENGIELSIVKIRSNEGASETCLSALDDSTLTTENCDSDNVGQDFYFYRLDGGTRLHSLKFENRCVDTGGYGDQLHNIKYPIDGTKVNLAKCKVTKTGLDSQIFHLRGRMLADPNGEKCMSAQGDRETENNNVGNRAKMINCMPPNGPDNGDWHIPLVWDYHPLPLFLTGDVPVSSDECSQICITDRDTCQVAAEIPQAGDITGEDSPALRKLACVNEFTACKGSC